MNRLPPFLADLSPPPPTSKTGYRLLYDPATRGLCLRITKTGAKSWVHNRGTSRTLGSYDELSYGQARAEAEERNWAKDRALNPDEYYAGAEQRGLLTLSQIRTLPSALCGVYFLFLDGKLQRIGQSENIAQRVAKHRSDRRIPFNDCRVLYCRPEELDVLEARYVQRFCPPYNGKRQHHSRRPKP